MPFLTVFFYFIYEIYGRTSRNKTMKGVFVMIDNITLEAMENRFSDVNKVMQVMSEILSDKYDMKITLTAVPKEKEEPAA